MKKMTMALVMLGCLWAGQANEPVVNASECVGPPFVAASAPPLVMIVMERDHRLYSPAYNDASDLDDDGIIEAGYTHSIDYYGYFEISKCYVYDTGGTDTFIPSSPSTGKYCGGANEWSGNFLNWVSMSRMDVLKKVLYGGHRSSDSGSETVLEGVYIPEDAHSWGKEYAGADTRLLTPFAAPDSGKRHLFCGSSRQVNSPHLIRVALNDSHRIWEWSSTERPCCSGPNGGGAGTRRAPVGTRDDIQDYYVRVKVCTSMPPIEHDYCELYPGGGGTYKPIGLLQQFGEGDGTKVCSRTWKSCTTDSSCGTADGICVDKSGMFFGLITGSYTKNLSGGVLRKNIYSILDETNAESGSFQSSENVQGNIVITLDRMQPVGYTYSDYSYTDSSGGNCGWIETRALQEGECRMWGNPIGEMMYEGLRYFAGKGTPTSVFTYTGTQDSSLNLSKPDWGIKKGNTMLQPYDIYPACAKPFLLVISDVNMNFDSNQLPGADSNFGSFTGDLPGLNVSTYANIIGTKESLAGHDWFIGQSGSATDFLCTSKSVSNLSSIRGLCPEEPTKQGSYYSAALSYYGKQYMSQNTGKPNVTTVAVAMAPPIPDINIKLGDNNVRIVPTGKSVSGCYSLNTCYQNCTLTSDANGLHFPSCTSSAFCPTNQIVNFYIESIVYDTNNSITYAKFRINFEDSEQGADYDMDSMVTYTIEKLTGDTQIKVTLSSDYAAGCIDQALGFIISGTTEDGIFLPVKDKDVAGPDSDTPSVVSDLPLTWSKTFTASGSTAGSLKNPLWYAAKWGGFSDSNGNRIPDLVGEWDKDSNGDPDNYFFVSNPGKLATKLNEALSAILGRVGSAGAVATVTQQIMGQDIVVRGAFTSYEGDPDKLVWKGHLESYWPFDGCSIYPETICPTVAGCEWQNPGCESVCIDNTSESSCALHPGCQWANGECTATSDLFSTCSSFVNQTDCQAGTSCQWASTAHCAGLMYAFQKQDNWSRFCYEHHDHCWEAEDKLPAPNDRTIYTLINGTQKTFDSGNVCTDADWLALSVDANFTTTDCSQMINWIRGDSWSKGRDREDWVLGDIIYSTPVVVQSPSLSAVPAPAVGDCDTACTGGCDCDSDCAKECFFCYRECLQQRKKVTYVGGNDGMLHAFVTAVWYDDPNATANDDQSHWIYDPNEPNSECRNTNCDGKEQIGRELWAYIPSNLLSKMKELARQSYGTPGGCTHRYMVDLSPQAWDVFIDPDGVGTEPRQWRTVLLGGERGGGDTYFAIDVTDPDHPKILWEFPAFRNMVQVTGSGTSYQATLPFMGKTIYDQVKALPMSWSVPYAGKLKIPSGVGFLAADTVNSWTSATPVIAPSTRFAGDLSGWFAVIGGSPRIFDTADLPSTLTNDQKLATLKPNLLMIDIEKGVNIFQYVWPLLQRSLTAKWPNKASSAGGTHYSPYSMSNPVVLDIWDANGKLDNDGYLDHIYMGDLNGDFYSLKFNMDDPTSRGMQVDVWKTKTIPEADRTSNAFRAQDRQPMTVLPTVAFDDKYNLRMYFGTGKYDNIDGSSNDKTETAFMSFYNLKETSDRSTITQSTVITKQTTTPTTFSASADPATTSPLGFKMDDFGIRLYTHCDSSTFNTGCTWVASDGSADCCESNCTGACWSCVYDLLSAGERVIDSSLVAGKLVFFTTFLPKTEPCSVGGYAYLYILDYQCSPMTKNPLLHSGFTDVGSASSVVQEGQYGRTTSATGATTGYVAMLGPGMPSRPVLDSSGHFVFIQTSDGRIHRVEVDLAAPPTIPKGWKQE